MEPWYCHRSRWDDNQICRRIPPPHVYGHTTVVCREVSLCAWIWLTTKILWFIQAFTTWKQVERSKIVDTENTFWLVLSKRYGSIVNQPSFCSGCEASLLRCAITVMQQKVAPPCLFRWRSQCFRSQTALVCECASSCIEIVRQNCVFS